MLDGARRDRLLEEALGAGDIVAAEGDIGHAREDARLVDRPRLRLGEARERLREEAVRVVEAVLGECDESESEGRVGFVGRVREVRFERRPRRLEVAEVVAAPSEEVRDMTTLGIRLRRRGRGLEQCAGLLVALLLLERDGEDRGRAVDVGMLRAHRAGDGRGRTECAARQHDERLVEARVVGEGGRWRRDGGR